MSFQGEIDKARHLGEQLENLVVRRGEYPAAKDRDILLIGYWALLFDYNKGILRLLSDSFYGSAFALVRPVVEALIRSHLVMMCSDEDVRRIREDKYWVDFEKVGPQIDTAFGLEGFFENFLNHARPALHSYTHSGLFQLARRFDGQDVNPRYSEDEIVEVIRCSASAVFMVTALVTKSFKFEDEWKAANQLYTEWGKHS